MTFSEYTLETIRLPYDQSAQHARRKCIWHALSRRNRASIFAPSNVQGVSTSKEPWCSSNRRGVKSRPTSLMRRLLKHVNKVCGNQSASRCFLPKIREKTWQSDRSWLRSRARRGKGGLFRNAERQQNTARPPSGGPLQSAAQVPSGGRPPSTERLQST